MYECDNCGRVRETAEYITEQETGTDIALCPTCKCGHLHPMEMIKKTVDKRDVFEKLVFIVKHLNCLREEYEAAKNELEKHLQAAESDVYELFCELADVDSNKFLRLLDEAYTGTRTDSGADALLSMVEERMEQ